MPRPFAHTIQAQQLDPHFLWMVLLTGSAFLMLAWATWATSPAEVEQETTNVQLSSNRAPNLAQNQGQEEGLIEARFPKEARDVLAVGQKATLFVKGPTGERAIPMSIVALHDAAQEGEVRALLRPEGEAVDAFNETQPLRLKVSAPSRTPLEHWLPELSKKQ